MRSARGSEPIGLSSSDRDWEQLGRDDPYWAVLTSDRYRGAELSAAARDKFFDSGERHVADVFSIVDDLAEPDWRPRRALDFGCGVGRLLPALSARCGEVVGVDISQAMLDEAERNLRCRGIGNVELVCDSDSLDHLAGEFDVIHSSLAFQHIEVARGERILSTLCSRLSPDGFAALHFVTGTDEPQLSRLLASARGSFRPLHVFLNLLRGRPAREPLMRMHVYSKQRLRRVVADSCCVVVGALPRAEDRYESVVLIIRRLKA